MTNKLDSYIDKRASYKVTPMSQILRQAAPHIGAQVAVGVAMMGVGAAARASYQAITKRRDFRNMLQSNPDLQDHMSANPAQFNRHYNSLRSMNPNFATDPIVAGSYMRQMSLNPRTAGNVIVESLQAAKGQRGPSHVSMGWTEGEKPSGKLEGKFGF